MKAGNHRYRKGRARRASLAGAVGNGLAAVVLGAALASVATVQAAATPNGIGPDPDGDGNPATNVLGFGLAGPAAEAELDPPFRIVSFENPKLPHNTLLTDQHRKEFGVTFSSGLRSQICAGPRHFQYDSRCTYKRAPSGRFVGLYRDEFQRPLSVRFDQPVCAAAMAIYPTGGREGERFTATLQPIMEIGDEQVRLKPVKVNFTWTRDTFRWRNMVGALLADDLDKPGRQAFNRLEINVRSADTPRHGIEFLIDDLSFISFEMQPPGTTCQQVIDKVLAAAERPGRRTSEPGAQAAPAGDSAAGE